MCAFEMVIHQYLWRLVFVSDRVVCGTIYYQFASVDCSQIIQKINMRKIELLQGSVLDVNVADFMIRGRLTRKIEAPETRGLR